MTAALALLLATVAGCGDGAPGLADAGPEVDADADADTPADARLELPPPPPGGAPAVVELALPRPARVSVILAAPALVSLEVEGGAAVSSAWRPTRATPAGTWWRAAPLDADPPPLDVGGAARLRAVVRAIPPEPDVEHSLAWTDPELLDDPATVGLGRVMAAVATDGHGGRLLDRWLREFGRTRHSERPALVDLADALARAHGDPAGWDLDALPFRVTAVHDRIDLRDGAHCGELRVSMNVTHPEFPFIHLIFLFAQRPGDADVAVTGDVHCEDTAMRWTWLAAVEPAAFRAAARAELDRALTPEAFLLAESLERTVGNWEWRQWRPVGDAELGLAFDNPPLFQTVDAARLAEPGAARDDFLAWVDAEAVAIAAHRARVPERFAPPSARAAEGVPRAPVDVGERADADVLSEALDRVGCPGCHARSPTFLQTNADRTFSPFYAEELQARRRALATIATGAPFEAPFGALQDAL